MQKRENVFGVRGSGLSGYQCLPSCAYLRNSAEHLPRKVSVSCFPLRNISIFTSPYGAEPRRTARSQTRVSAHVQRGDWGYQLNCPGQTSIGLGFPIWNVGLMIHLPICATAKVRGEKAHTHQGPDKCVLK